MPFSRKQKNMEMKHLGVLNPGIFEIVSVSVSSFSKLLIMVKCDKTIPDTEK